MTYVINRRAQFEAGVVALTKEVNRLKKQVSNHEVEIDRLNIELDDQNDTFGEARTAVNEMNELKESNKKIKDDLEASLIKYNAARKSIEDL